MTTDPPNIEITPDQFSKISAGLGLLWEVYQTARHTLPTQLAKRVGEYLAETTK